MTKIIKKGLMKANSPILSKISLVAPVMVFPELIKTTKKEKDGNKNK